MIPPPLAPPTACRTKGAVWRGERGVSSRRHETGGVDERRAAGLVVFVGGRRRSCLGLGCWAVTHNTQMPGRVDAEKTRGRVRVASQICTRHTCPEVRCLYGPLAGSHGSMSSFVPEFPFCRTKKVGCWEKAYQRAPPLPFPRSRRFAPPPRPLSLSLLLLGSSVVRCYPVLRLHQLCPACLPCLLALSPRLPALARL